MARSTNLSIGWLIVAILGAIILIHPVHAQQPDRPPTLSLSLADCIRLTLRNNLLLQQQRLDPQIKGRQITMEKSLFDPKLILATERGYSETLTPIDPWLAGTNVDEVEELNLNIGMEKKLLTGGSLKLDFNNQRYGTNSTWQAINPYYESLLSLSLTQPLLKDFGISVNEAQIDISVNNHRISIMELKQEMLAILSQSQKLYWDLVYNTENLRVKRLLLKQAQDLLEKNKAKAEAGLMAHVEVLEAESEVAARQEEVIIAQDSLRDAEDELKRITNLISRPGGLSLSLIPTEQPTFQPQQPDVEQSTVLALENRPEYVQAKMELKNSQLNLMLAENKTLPELNLNGSVGLSGLGEDYDDNWDELSTADYEIWSVGVTLSLPLGNRWAYNNRIQRKLEQEQTALELKEIEQGIILEVRQALRQLNTDLKRIDTTRIAQKLEEEKLKIEEQKFELGMTTSHDLLEYQAQLAQAKIKHLKAIIDYNKSLIELEAVKGTTLKKHHIELKELYPSS